VYQALVVVLAGVVVYAFRNAQRVRAGEVAVPADNPLLEAAPGTGE
jgi:basic amino acid/polyamine antiporter, APA family